MFIESLEDPVLAFVDEIENIDFERLDLIEVINRLILSTVGVLIDCSGSLQDEIKDNSGDIEATKANQYNITLVQVEMRFTSDSDNILHSWKKSFLCSSRFCADAAAVEAATAAANAAKASSPT